MNEEEVSVAVQRVSNEQVNQVERIRYLMGKPYDVIAQRADGGLYMINESHAGGYKSKDLASAAAAKINPAYTNWGSLWMN